MNKFFIIISTFILSGFCYSQNWINSAGGNFNDESYDVEVDASGNIYTTGYTTAASVFGPSINLTTNGYSDIYVSKSDANGNFLWVKVFGSTLADRGYDIALDNSGNIYVTGYFQGTANFGSIQLTASGNSQDIFVLKLDNNGNVLWVKSEGGNEGDTGYGITVDNNGDVIVTGQFKGTAQIGLNNFSSAIDPNSGLPAYDMFISKYDANGNNLWSIQGIAKYDDRGLAVKTDSNNDIYVTGQFSDTLTIAGSQHNNTIFNAGMLLKLDPTGNEIWFRRMGAVQTLVYDVEIDNSDDVYITGDFQGQMIIIGNTTNYFLNGNYTYRIFLIKMAPNGEVIWMQEDDSDSEVSSKAICLDVNQDPYIAGTFKCVMNEYADTLGSGLFNSVGYNDVFITKYNKSGQRQWMRQYGGPLNDYCSGIAISQADNPVISGGYTEYFNYPYSPTTFSNFPGINKGFSGYSWSPGCPADTYRYLNAVGAKDIMIGRPVNLNLNHYYYYELTSCYNANNPPCIEFNCPDSVTFCGSGTIRNFTFTAGNGFYYENYNATPFNPHHGPYYDFLWNTGDTTLSINTNISGYYSVQSERIDGCLSSKDSIYVTVNPLPQLPNLTDDHGFNNQNYPPYNNIKLCYPDTATTWFNDLDSTYQFTYTTPTATYNDSLPHQIYTDGFHSVNVVDTNGCTRNAGFNLIYDYPVSDTIIPYILFNKDSICEGETVCYVVADSITNPTGNYTAFCSNAILSPSTNCLTGCISPTATGWYTVNYNFIIGYDNLCGSDTVHYSVTDSVYITVMNNPSTSIYTVSGDPLLCPGDTINVWTDSIISGFNWSGPSILTINAAGDTIFANQQGSYSYSGTLTDTTTGCSSYISKSFFVAVKPSPTITSNVPDNIICPNDSILLTCVQSGINYDWIGPQGNSIGSNQSIWVNVAGFYHCVLTDNDGCVLTSNTIELKEYNTPYIIADPGTELCHTGSIELTAFYSGSPGVQWYPAGSANDPDIIVNQPGTYYVEVTQCGFTVTDSVVITDANLNISVIPLTNTTICPGDTAILTTNSGMASYEWSPVQHYGQTLMTTDTGDYYVTVFDGATGCSAVSDTVHISMHPGGITPNVQGQTVCLGDSATLINLNSWLTTNWYSDSISTIPFSSNSSITLYNLINDTTIYVENYDTSCTSPRIAVHITVIPTNGSPNIYGDTILCEGQTLNLYTDNINGASYQWSNASGTISTLVNYIDPFVTLNDTGYYYLTVNGVSCINSNNSVFIAIHPKTPAPTIFGDTAYCTNDTLLLYTNSNLDSLTWIDPNFNYSHTDSLEINPVLSGHYTLLGIDTNGCSSEMDSIYVSTLPSPPIPNIYTQNLYCSGDSMFISTDTINGITYSWTGPNAYANNDESDTLLNVTPNNSGVYQLTITDTNGCSSSNQTYVNVNDYPVIDLGPDTVVCIDSLPYLLAIDTIYNNYLWQDGNTNHYYNVIDSGWYYVTVEMIGGCSTTDSIYIDIEHCNSCGFANVFSPNGDGINDYFVIENLEYFPNSRLEVFDRWGKLIYESDNYENNWGGGNQHESTYYFIFYPNDPIGVVPIYKGYVTLTR